MAADRILLVVDDEADVGRLLQLALKKHFAAIHLASSADGAERVLRTTQVTHVVCDHHLGGRERSGATLLRGWRSSCPSIRYAALFSGSTSEEFESAVWIEDVFVKPRGFMSLMQRLQTVR